MRLTVLKILVAIGLFASYSAWSPADALAQTCPSGVSLNHLYVCVG